MIDALLIAGGVLKRDSKLENETQDLLKEHGFYIIEVFKKNRKFLLETGHRRENFGEGFQNICKSLSILARNNPDIDIVYPVHLNPNVQKPVLNCFLVIQTYI